MYVEGILYQSIEPSSLSVLGSELIRLSSGNQSRSLSYTITWDRFDPIREPSLELAFSTEIRRYWLQPHPTNHRVKHAFIRLLPGNSIGSSQSKNGTIRRLYQGRTVLLGGRTQYTVMGAQGDPDLTGCTCPWWCNGRSLS
jgi:hypothetical protein